MPLESFDSRAFRHKIETVENTAETPAEADAVEFLNGTINVRSDELEIAKDRPDGGARPVVPIRRRVEVGGEIPLIGAATAGDAGPYSGLIRNFGHTEVLNTAPDNAEYTPVLKGFPSATLWGIHAGELIKARGLRGRFTSLTLAINDYPKAGFECLGQLVEAPSEVAAWDDDLAAFTLPITGTEANMEVLLGGVALEAVSLELDTGTNLQLAYNTEAVVSRHSARQVTGTLRVYRPLIATADIRSMAAGATLQAMVVDYVTGTAAKDLSLEADAGVQVGEPENVDIDGLRGWDIPIRFTADYVLRFGSRT